MRSQVSDVAALLQVPLDWHVVDVTACAYPLGHVTLQTVSCTTSAQDTTMERHVAPKASGEEVQVAGVMAVHRRRQLSLSAARRNPVEHEQAKEPALGMVSMQTQTQVVSK